MTDKKKKRYLEVLEEIKKERNLNVEEEKKKFDNYWKQYEASVQDSTLSRQSSMTAEKTLTTNRTSEDIEKEIKDLESESGRKISFAEEYARRVKTTEARRESERVKKEINEEKNNLTDEYNIAWETEGTKLLNELDEEGIELLDKYIKEHRKTGLILKGYTESEIKKMADIRERALNAEMTAKEMEKSVELAEDHEVIASILSIGQKNVGGIVAPFDAWGQRIKNPYRKIDTNTRAFLFTNKANAARQEVASDMGPAGAFLYNTGMSIGDMSLAMLAGNKAAALSGAAKVGSATTLGSMSTQAFSDTVIDLTARGASAEQAVRGGLAAGAFEILFEKVSLGNFNKLKQVPATDLKGFAKNVAKATGVNASEEMATEAANIIYDTLANGDISNLELQVKALMEAGYSESEAKEEVKKGFRLQVLEAGLAGGLTGGTLGVAGQAKGTYRASQNSKAIIESEVEKRAGEERKKTAIDNEVEKIIAERSETFGELSEKEKNAIREDVINKVENGKIDYSETEIKDDIIKGIQKQVNEELDRGELSIDAVETALAKEEKETINRLSEELENAKTDEERSRVEAEINKTRLSLAEKMQKSLRSDIRLQEIYKQEMLKSEDIDVVEQKTDSDITKELIKSAKAVNMNNTRKSHELFDFVNKVANDIKTNYRFVNDAQLRQLGYEVDGQAVNGLVRKNSDGTYNVLLNVEAGKESQALAVIIGHETTHLLETTEEYSRLKTLLKEYAKSKGEYDSKLESIKKLYKDVDADIEGEVTADLIGEYLLADEKFVKELSAKEPNIFQKLYNHIKRIVKMATAGSEQQKRLLKLQESFKKAYKELGSTQKTSEIQNVNEEIKYHISESFSKEIDKALNNELGQNSQVKARDYTPAILVENGVKDLPMLITQRHVKTIIYSEAEAKELGLPTGNRYNYHGLGKDLLVKSIDSMDNPLEIYKQDNDHYLIITDVKDDKDNRVIVPVKVDGKGTYNDVYIDENQILSVYGKKNIEKYIERKKYELIYKKDEITLNPGVQFPDISNSVNNSIFNTEQKSNIKSQNSAEEVKYSLKQFEDGRRFVEVDKDTTSFDGLTTREQGALATKIIKEKFAGKVIGIDNRVFVNGRSAGEYGFPVKKLGREEHDAKMRASIELDNIVDAGFNFRNEADGKDGHIHNDVIGGFDYFDAIFKIGNKYFQGTINIKNVEKGKLFKDLTKIKDVTEDISSSYGETPKSTFLRTSSTNSISNTEQKSNIKYSNSDEEVKYSLENLSDGTEYVRAEKGTFVKDDGTRASQREVFNSLVGKTIRLQDGDVYILKRLPDKDMYNELFRRYPKNVGGIEDIKALNESVNYNLEELLTNSKMQNSNIPDKNERHKEQGIINFDTRTVSFYDGSNAYKIDFSIGVLQNGEKVAYAKKFYGKDETLTEKIQANEIGVQQYAISRQPDVNNSISNTEQKSNIKSQNSAEEVKYSLKQFEDGRRFVEVDQMQERFEGHNISEFPRIAKDIINEKFVGKVVGIDNKMFVNGKGRDEYSNPSKYISGDIYEAKLRTSGEIDNLLDAGVNFRNEADGKDGHIHKNITGGFDYFDTLFKIGDRYYEAVINIMNIKRGKLFKDVTKIKDVTQDIMSSYGKNPKSQFLRTSSTNSISNTEQKSNIKYSLAGKRSRTADLTMKQKAAQMLEEGKSAEEIWYKTGWKYGNDHEWRYEIDDSKAIVRTRGDADLLDNSEYKRTNELFEKFLRGEITDKERTEYIELSKKFNDKSISKLKQVLKHDDLYKAYPQLEDVNLEIIENEEGAPRGSFNQITNTIKIREDIFRDEKQFKKTLLHEIQHRIQAIEDFERGGSPEKVLNVVRNEFAKYLENLMPEDVKKAEEQDAKEGGDKYRKALVDGFIKKYYNLKEIDEKVKFQFYQNLMGEREARSVAERAELTEEERKGVYPNYDEGAFRRGTGDDVFQIKQERTGNDKKTVQVIQDITKEVGERNDQENKPLLPTKNRQDSNVLGSLVGRGITDEKVPYKGAFLNTADSENLDVKFSLRNKNITEETEIPYVVNNQYITVQKNNKIALAELQDRVKNLPRGTYENKATGYKADINRRTIGKILNPTKRFNPWSKSHNYIENLNAAAYLPELFENAVYLDTHENQKKNNGEEFHYFVAPIYMNNKAQRALITARSGEKYDVLYVVRVEVIENKEDAQAAEQMLSASIGSPSTITIPDLIKDVKIYNYDTQENQKYSPEDIKYHLSKRGEDIAPVKGWAIYGKDVLVKNRKTGDDIAPVRGDILPEAGSKTENAATVMEDIAPVRKDIKPKTTEMSGDIAPVKATEKITEYVNTQPRGEEKQRPLLRSAIGSTSREIKRLYGSKYDPTKDIARLYKGIHEGKYNEEEIARISTDIGQRIVENIKSKKVRTDEANEVLGLLRQTKVKLDSEQKTEVEAKYGSYNEYRKNMMGKIILSKDGTSLEAVWEDWSELYPDIFDIDMDPKAMPEELENIMSSLQRSYQIEDTPDAEEVGAEIYDRFFSIPQRKKTRAEVQDELFEGIRKEFENNGYDIDEVFSNAKSKTTFSSVDNTPQRFIEKTFGYKAGQIINDLTINKEAENESKCVRWLNTITGKKTGLLPRLSEKYNIKPGSKEDAAVQMYAEGFYVNKKQEYVRYGDEELAKDFPDEQTQENIKKLARDPEVRAFYDNTLRMINETRKRNAYPEIPKRENYFLHFHAMEDTFSKIGIPFNINDIKLKDLPSDLNGITAGLRPGQPYFASANRRTGIRTTYGALRGMERYAFAAGRQIYHIDDIQTLRAIWKHIADTYGQAKGLENLDELDRKQQEEQIKRVYDGHLSTFARFINEQANILAGKTAALDRGFESIFGRKGLAVLNFFDKQAGRNAVGYNISSALTNLVAGVQGISKMPKADAIKAFAQTASNKLNNLRGEDDGFAEQNDFIVRRKGSSSFYRTPWQKATDRGYVMMQAVDDITTEFVVRGKYNEYIRRGMSEADAHEQAGKWAAKLLGDRSLGQMPQLYNSKVMNIFAKFQLEVRNQLDSMLYDTVKEAEIDTESISSAKKRNSIKAAKITSTLAQLAVFQHLFGKAFEAVTGYNPAFDIISVLMTMLGIGDDEDSEDTFKDNLEQAFFELLEDLPYTSTLTGGRIPISSMLPVEELVTGKDSYGNEKSRLKTLLEASPYLLPAGYGQIKKTYQGLKMFDEDLPVKGSYTNSGNLRYPVEDTVMNRIQAGLFGQYANKNAREYFDEERIPLKTKDIEEYKELNIPIGDYWKYKDEIKKRDTKPEKVDYISSLDLPVSKKNLLANNVLDRKEKVDLDGYEDYGSFEEFDFATKNPGEYSISKTVGGYSSYKKYREEISSFKADRDSNGKSISGTKKAKIVNYINSLNTSYGSKLILYKMQYPSDDTYNYEIVEYLNSQQYLSYNDIKEALEAMEFTVDSEGNVRW
jgi:hypothetical protein